MKREIDILKQKKESPETLEPEHEVAEAEFEDKTNETDETKNGKSLVQKMTPSKPNSAQELTSSISGFINRFKHKCFLYVLTQSNGFQRMKAIEYGTFIKAPNLEIARVTEPYIDLSTGAHIYFTTLNASHTVAVCEDSFRYYTNLDALRGKATGKDVIPDLYAKANQYHLVEEIKNSNRSVKRDVLFMVLCLVAGAAIGNWIDALTGADGGTDIQVQGNYNENVNPNDNTGNDNNNNNGNGNGNGDPVVIP